MGYYLNPPQALPSIGRALINGSYEELKSQLLPDEVLVVHLDRGPFQNAGILYSKEEYVAFRTVVTSRNFLGYYAVHRGILPQYGVLPENIPLED